MSNRIELYQNNTTTLVCSVIGGIDLTNFIPQLTIKKKASDTTSILTKVGIVSDPSTSLQFNINTIDTSMNPGSYVYDISIETINKSQVYTLVKDVFVILDGVK